MSQYQIRHHVLEAMFLETFALSAKMNKQVRGVLSPALVECNQELQDFLLHLMGYARHYIGIEKSQFARFSKEKITGFGIAVHEAVNQKLLQISMENLTGKSGTLCIEQTELLYLGQSSAFQSLD